MMGGGWMVDASKTRERYSLRYNVNKITRV